LEILEEAISIAEGMIDWATKKDDIEIAKG